MRSTVPLGGGRSPLASAASVRMNPFVKLKKRSILLPTGCKDLIDVLQVETPAA